MHFFDMSYMHLCRCGTGVFVGAGDSFLGIDLAMSHSLAGRQSWGYRACLPVAQLVYVIYHCIAPLICLKNT